MTAPTWAPEPEAVAAYVTSRTVDLVGSPGSDEPTETFTATTTPSQAQVFQLIEDACSWVTALTGAIDSTLESQAAAVAALRTAGMIELSYPMRNAEIDAVASPLLLEAFTGRAELVDANRAAGVVVPGSAAAPSYDFPTADPWCGNEPVRFGFGRVW